MTTGKELSLIDSYRMLVSDILDQYFESSDSALHAISEWSPDVRAAVDDYTLRPGVVGDDSGLRGLPRISAVNTPQQC